MTALIVALVLGVFGLWKVRDLSLPAGLPERECPEVMPPWHEGWVRECVEEGTYSRLVCEKRAEFLFCPEARR
jgi:hypothetical protein